MSIKILATADLHIGRMSSSIPESSEKASTKHTWFNIIDYAEKNAIDVLLLAGDIVDLDNRYFEASGPLQTGFERLRKKNIKVYIVAGNHDYQVLPQLISHHKFSNVKILGENGKWESEIYSKDDINICFFGWSFPENHVYENPVLALDEIKLNSENTNIGLLHCDTYSNTGPYAPTPVDSLKIRSIDAWILGHIHKPDILNDHKPIIRYCGSPHALSSKEPGIHGPLLITAEKNKLINIETIPMSPVRYEDIKILIKKDDSESVVRKKISEQLSEKENQISTELIATEFLIYDILLVGEHSSPAAPGIWTERISSEYSRELQTGRTVSVRKVTNNLNPAITNIEELAKETSPAGILAKTIIDIENNRPSDFINELIRKMRIKTEEVNFHATFMPLNIAKRQLIKDDEIIKKLVLQECKQLLGNLLADKT